MFKLRYPSRSARWPGELNFTDWHEYWKTLGYLSNPNIHEYYIRNRQIYKNENYDISIKHEYNSRTESYSDTGRLYYYGYLHNETWFRYNFEDLYSSRAGSPGGNVYFRINRKEFIETLEYDLKFIKIRESGVRDPIIIPEENNFALAHARLDNNFIFEAWEFGWDLANS